MENVIIESFSNGAIVKDTIDFRYWNKGYGYLLSDTVLSDVLQHSGTVYLCTKVGTNKRYAIFAEGTAKRFPAVPFVMEAFTGRWIWNMQVHAVILIRNGRYVSETVPTGMFKYKHNILLTK